MKKAIIAGALLLIGSALISSCGDLFSYGVKFTEEKEVASLEAILEKHIDPEDEIIQILFTKADNDPSNFGFNKGKIELWCIDQENRKQQIKYTIDIKKNELYINEWDKENRFPVNKQKAYSNIKASDLGCDRIAEFVNKAVEMMTDENLKANGLGSYIIYPNSDPDKVKHSFAIERITGSGQRTTEYVEYKFEASPKTGELKSKK